MSVISALPAPFVKHCPQQENWTFRRLTFSRAQNCFLGARTTLWATDKYYTKKSYAGVIFRPLPSLSLLSPPLKMKLKTALFFLAMVAQRHRLALSTPRPRVVTSGPTMGPNFSRMTGKREFFLKKQVFFATSKTGFINSNGEMPRQPSISIWWGETLLQVANQGQWYICKPRFGLRWREAEDWFQPWVLPGRHVPCLLWPSSWVQQWKKYIWFNCQ